MNKPALEDRIFDDAIRKSHLLTSVTPEDRKAARALVDFQKSLDPAYQKIINGALSLGQDTHDLTRTTEGVSRLCHMLRMAGNIVRINKAHIASHNIDLYVLALALAITHDDPEESLREHVREYPRLSLEEQARARRSIIKDAENGLLNVINLAFPDTKRTSGRFSTLLYEDIIRSFYHPMTPGFKARGLGPASFVTVMGLVCDYDSGDEASIQAALMRALVKVPDRIDDITHLHPASPGFQDAVANEQLRKYYNKQRTGSMTKEELKEIYRDLKKYATVRWVEGKQVQLYEISSAKKTEAAWKAVFAYNAVAQLLDETAQHDDPSVRRLRKPLARALPALLGQLGIVAERLSLFLVNYHNLSHRDRKDIGGVDLPENDAALYDRLQQLAQEYSKLDEFYELQAEPGTEGLSMFRGSTAHMARVEMKDKALRHFDRDYMDHLIRNVAAGMVSKKFLPRARSYATRLNNGSDPKQTGLLYFPNQQQILTELIK